MKKFKLLSILLIILLSTFVFSKDSAKKGAFRKPASTSGDISCSSEYHASFGSAVLIQNYSQLEDQMNADCDKTKPFSIATGNQGGFTFCCIAK